MKVLITRKIPQAGIEILKQHSNLELDYRQGAPLSPEELLTAIKGVSAIIPVIPDKITRQILEAGMPDLQLVAHYAVGYDNIDVEAATNLGVFVSNTPGDLTISVAEHTVALMFSVARKIVEADAFCRRGNYKYWDPMIFLGPSFKEKTMGIIGYGRIGRHLADIVEKGLGMHVIYYDVVACAAAGGAKQCDLDYLLSESDVISINCNLCPETRHLIGERELKKMKPTAYLINTARGPIVHEDALALALREGWIEGAALDVFENEPRIHADLLKLSNVVLSPHIASATREARIQMAHMVANNVVEVLINKNVPINWVNGVKK